MAKMLKPTLRERNRYIAFEVASDSSFERKPVVDAIWSSLLRLFGEVGAAKTSLWVMDWEKAKKKGIIKVNHKSVQTIRQCMAQVREIDGRKASINTLTTSGTLKGARKRL
ncbi:MAG: Rpp14/Pop5 family protein [Candidatus Altiarchaeota archaeon]